MTTLDLLFQRHTNVWGTLRATTHVPWKFTLNLAAVLFRIMQHQRREANENLMPKSVGGTGI